MNNKIAVIGVTPEGKEGLSVKTLALIENAGILIGGQRLLDMFGNTSAEKIPIADNLRYIAERIKSDKDRKRITVLASGDPGFFGIAGYLLKKLGKENIVIYPNISSVQTAFARIGETWQDAMLVSAHGRDLEAIIPDIASSGKVAILTDDKNTPAAIARTLHDKGLVNFRAYVCQDMGADNEQVEEFTLKDMPDKKFSALSVLILIRETDGELPEMYPGIPDDEFFRRKPKAGLITKQETRAITLSKLRLNDNCIFWDIGAGSGAVSIEASYYNRKGKIYAIEKNDEDIDIINRNIRKFRRYNISVVKSTAPDNLDNLPEPNAVFIGGSAGRMADIIEYVYRRIADTGMIVINAASLENLDSAVKSLKNHGCVPEITLVNISRSTGVLNLTRMEALNPVFIISAKITKKETAN